MKVVHTGTFYHNKFRREVEETELPSGGKTKTLRSVPDGQELVAFEVLLDEAAVYTMAAKAANNRSGRSKDGPLIVKITTKR